MNTFAIHTLGCKVNTYESQGMVEDFLAHGYQQVGFHEASDVYVIHTCAVTNTAASKSRQDVLQQPHSRQFLVGTKQPHQSCIHALRAVLAPLWPRDGSPLSLLLTMTGPGAGLEARNR